MADIEYLALPRLVSAAQIGWSPAATHCWTAFAARLGVQASRWRAMGLYFYRSPQVLVLTTAIFRA